MREMRLVDMICGCGMPLSYKEDVRQLWTDPYEGLIILRCQHCGKDTPLLSEFYSNPPAWMAGWNTLISRS